MSPYNPGLGVQGDLTLSVGDVVVVTRENVRGREDVLFGYIKGRNTTGTFPSSVIKRIEVLSIAICAPGGYVRHVRYDPRDVLWHGSYALSQPLKHMEKLQKFGYRNMDNLPTVSDWQLLLMGGREQRLQKVRAGCGA